MTTNDEDLKSINMDRTGRIRVWIDGECHTLRPPKLGEFKRIKTALTTGQDELQELADRARAPGVDEEAVGEISDEIVERGVATIVKTLRLAFELLADKPLPEDEDDWPAWLAMSDTVVSDFMVHWRTVPLGRGK